MNTNDARPIEPSDDEILAGVRRRMADVESLVPLPPAWQRSAVVGAVGRASVRTSVRSRVRFGGFAPLVAIAAVLVIVVGVGLGSRPGGWGGAPATSLGAGGVTITLQLYGTTADPVTDSALQTTSQILLRRLESAGVASATIQKLRPDKVAVHIPGAHVDVEALVSLLGVAGRLDIVLLPKATYGAAGSPGSVAIPQTGTALDPALLASAEYSGADLDPNSINAVVSPDNPDLWVVNCSLVQAKAAEFQTWTGQHINEYLAIVLDGIVQQVPYIASPITGGAVQIAGNFTAATAKTLAVILQYGALPFPIAEASYTEDGITPASLPISSPATRSSDLFLADPSITTPTDIPSSGRTLGNSNAPVTIDIWSDYQCPVCRDFEVEVLPQLIEQYVRPGKARIVVHDMIVIDTFVGGHESKQAAEAARCAADQGKFWQYQDWLWANQYAEGSGAFSIDRLIVLAGKAGLDTQVFSRCLNDGTHAADVQADTAGAGSAGISGTPTVAINGHVLATVDYATVSAAIDGASPSPSPSPSPSVTPVTGEVVPLI